LESYLTNKNLMKEDHYHELAAKYFSGNPTDAEVQQLERWVLSAKENKQQFLELQRSWNLANVKEAAAKINVTDEWNAISEKLSNSDDDTKGKVVALKVRTAYTKVLQIAAAVLLLIVSGLYFYNTNKASNSLLVSSENTIIEEQLKDGTQVNLNQFSSISYEDAKDGTRKVALQGDAFFDVARDESRPFVIKTEEVDVTVLGTSFYVDAREGQDEIQVIVASGKVEVEAGGKKVILTKGEVGTYVKSSQTLSEKQNKDVNYMAWKTNRLVYEEALLEKVVQGLGRTFHADIKLKPAGLKNCTLTATYEGQELGSILRILEKTLNLKATINGERIVLSGSPCE
jgi:transmembrane sensor